MSDQPQNTSSLEEVAYRLFHDIARVENYVFANEAAAQGTVADREYILTAVSDCVHALRGGIYSKKKEFIVAPLQK